MKHFNDSERQSVCYSFSLLFFLCVCASYVVHLRNANACDCDCDYDAIATAVPLIRIQEEIHVQC